MENTAPRNLDKVMPGIADHDPTASLLLAKRGYRKRVAILLTIAIGAFASALFTLFAAFQSFRIAILSPDASSVAQTVAAVLAVAATVCAAIIAVSELKMARADKSKWLKRDDRMLSC